MTPVSDFYTLLRLLLRDADPQGVYQYSDDELAGAVKGVFKLGLAPEGYSLSGADISPTLPDGDAYARVCYEAALLLMVGDEGALSYGTRPLTVRRSGDRKRDLLFELRNRLHEVETRGGVFASYQSLSTWLRSFGGPADLVEVRVQAPVARLDIGPGGATLERA